MAGGRGNIFVGKAAFSKASPRLIFFCFVYALGSIFFGYDAASFGGVQAFTPFIRKFGVQTGATTYTLPSVTTSLMNSLPLLGKLLGTIFVGQMIEVTGHKWTMFVTCWIQIAGAVIQVTSTTAAQFIVGRFLVYTAVGLVENVVPTYQSEIAPAALRGFMVGSIQLCLTFGSLIAGIVNQFLSQRNDDLGWQIATAIQFIPAVFILVLLYFTPLSPRWLVSKERYEDALQVLKLSRRQADVDSGACELELAAIREENQDAVRPKGPWKDLFKGTNRRRTGIACSIMTLQQLTGVTFSSSYGTTFYKSVGLTNMAFAYTAINNGVSVVTAMMAMIVLDLFGRRIVTFHGCWTQAVFLALIGALGSKVNPSASETNGMVASFIIYAAILHASLGPSAYVTAAEVGTGALREKTMAISTAVNVVVSFVVVFTTPYLLTAIGAKTAYIWMACSAAGAVWVWLYMPELKNRNLEEIDELFEAHLPAWRFGKYETTGLSHDLATVGKDKTAKMLEVEDQDATA